MPNNQNKKNIEISELDLLKSIDEKLSKQLKPEFKTFFFRGVINGLGFALGTTVLLGITLLILRQFLTIPVIGEFVRQVIEIVETNSDSKSQKN